MSNLNEDNRYQMAILEHTEVDFSEQLLQEK